MFNKKQILSVVLSVFVSAVLVALAVSAATTVGDNVSVGGTLAVTATTTLSTTLLVDTNVLYADSNENKVGVNSTSTSNIFAVATSSTAVPAFLVTTGGLVGISSTSPATALSVTGTSTLQTVLPDADNSSALGSTGKRWKTLDLSATSTIGGPLLVDTNVLYADSNENKVGVNSTSTSDIFAVATSSTAVPAFKVDTDGKVGIGTNGTVIARHLSTSTAIDLPSVDATSCATSAVSVGLSGVAAGDIVIAGPTSAGTGAKIEMMPLVWSALASSTADYVTLTVCNGGHIAFNADSQTWRFDVWKH